ncbi:PRD domain-containing protein [Bacillus thuringiensis]|nr:PRD domain-containing protein [Bacillus thuringiensis]
MIKDINFIEYFDRHIIRQEQLLKILIREDKWYQLDELENELQWAKKTISKDLIILKSSLPTNWKISAHKGRGIRLSKPLESSLSDIIYLIRKNNNAFQIFQHILFSKHSSVLSLSKQLLIPYRSTSKIIKKIELHLKQYGLELDTHPYLQIKGSERAIRSYITQFYETIYVQHWPFLNYDQQMIMNPLSIFEKKLGITFFQGDKHHLAVCLCITINRIKTKNSILMPNEDASLLQHTMFYEAFEHVVPYLEKTHNISFSNHEIVYFTGLLIGANYSYKDKKEGKKRTVQRIRDNASETYSRIYICIHSIEQQLGVSLWQDDELLFQLSLCLRRIFYHLRIYSIEFKLHAPSIITENSLTKKIKEHFPTVFDAVKKQYEVLFEHCENEIPDEEIAVITLHIVANQMLQHTQSVQVLLHVAENEGVYRFIHAWLLKHFSNQIEIIPFSKQTLQEKVTQNKHRLIVTNIHLDFDTSVPIIKISELPTRRDQQSIQNFIAGFVE